VKKVNLSTLLFDCLAYVCNADSKIDKVSYVLLCMRVGIIGINGFGKFHAQWFSYNGAQIAGVCGTKNQMDDATSIFLEKKLGYVPPYYSDVDLLLSQNLDAVVIASSPASHESILSKCCEANVATYCEKPFLYGLGSQNVNNVKRLLRDFSDRGVCVALNVQYPYLAAELYDDSNSFTFEMIVTKKGSIPIVDDLLLHPISVMYDYAGVGDVSNLRVGGDSRSTAISFTYTSSKQIDCRFIFGVGDKAVRKIGFSSVVEYTPVVLDGTYHALLSDGRTFKDPMNLAIADFMAHYKDANYMKRQSDLILHCTDLYEQIRSAVKFI
jgi:hypothetical protein